MSTLYGGRESEVEGDNNTPSSLHSSSSGVNLRAITGGTEEMASTLLVASSIAPGPGPNSPSEADAVSSAQQQQAEASAVAAEPPTDHLQEQHLQQQQMPPSMQHYGYHQMHQYPHIPHHVHMGHHPQHPAEMLEGVHFGRHLDAYGTMGLPSTASAGMPSAGVHVDEASDDIPSHENVDEGEEIEGEDNVDEQDETSDSGPIKLFVGQIPKHLAEEEIFPTFAEYGAIKDLMIIRDKVTSQHRGCAFVTFWTAGAATRAQEDLHDKFYFPGGRKPVQIKPATSSGGHGHAPEGLSSEQENKLFVGMTSRNADEDSLHNLFAPFGEIREIYIIRNADGTNKGCAFLKFTERESALAAIENLNEKYQMEGATRPLIVKFADTRGHRRSRSGPHGHKGSGGGHGPQRGQGHSGQGSPFFISSGPPVPVYPGYQQQGHQIPPLAMPPQGAPYSQSHYSHPPPPHSYLYQPPSYGHSPYGYHPSAPYGAGQGAGPNVTTSSSSPEMFEGGPRGGPPMQQQRGSQGSRQHQRHSSRSPKPPAYRQHRQEISSTVNPRPKEGPPGANLFIYHLPHDLTDADLATAFNPFGNVISAKVYVDKYTGESKGFGFVSYDSIPSAEQAIEQMNGFQIGSKRLKVQHKRIHKSTGSAQTGGEAGGGMISIQPSNVMLGVQGQQQPPMSTPQQQEYPSQSYPPDHLDVEGLADDLEGLEVNYREGGEGE